MCGIVLFLKRMLIGIMFVNIYLNLFDSPLTIFKITINDLLGGRGWWLVKGALVRGPFLFAHKFGIKQALTFFAGFYLFIYYLISHQGQWF